MVELSTVKPVHHYSATTVLISVASRRHTQQSQALVNDDGCDRKGVKRAGKPLIGVLMMRCGKSTKRKSSMNEGAVSVVIKFYKNRTKLKPFPVIYVRS